MQLLLLVIVDVIFAVDVVAIAAVVFTVDVVLLQLFLQVMLFLLLLLLLVVCDVPEAGLSVNDKTTYSDEVYFNTKHDCTVYTQVEIS